jgi:hypothetical protein
MAAMVLDYATVTGEVSVHSSPAVVPELLFAGVMLQFLASVGQLTAFLQPQSFYSQRNAWSPFDARGGQCAIYTQLQRLERFSLIDLSEVGRSPVGHSCLGSRRDPVRNI